MGEPGRGAAGGPAAAQRSASSPQGSARAELTVGGNLSAREVAEGWGGLFVLKCFRPLYPPVLQDIIKW